MFVSKVPDIVLGWRGIWSTITLGLWQLDVVLNMKILPGNQWDSLLHGSGLPSGCSVDQCRLPSLVEHHSDTQHPQSSTKIHRSINSLENK